MDKKNKLLGRPHTRAVPALLRQMNVRRVLDVLWRVGSASRADLTRHTGISAPTMSKLFAGLEQAGLLEQEAKLQLTAGRPSSVYRLATSSTQILGAVIGVRECVAVAAGLDGRIEERRQVRFQTPATYDELMQAFVHQLNAVRKITRTPCLGLGVSAPGLINTAEHRIMFSPNLHYTDGRQPGLDLARQLKVDAGLLQEEQGLCLAEHFFGVARGVNHFAIVDITEGLGMGVVSDGRFVSGLVGYGGELGHMTVEPEGERCGCGNRGCLELIATDRALALAVSRKTGRKLDIEEVIRGVRGGALEADAEIQRTVDYLAIGLALVINLFNPALLVVYGRLFDIRDGLFDQLIARVGERALKPSFAACRLVRAQSSKPLGALAAVIHNLWNTLGPRVG